jgi:phosphoglycolate phosphatase
MDMKSVHDAEIKGIIFDKDGTLFDFNATWGAWAQHMLRQEAGGDEARLAALAQVLGYDLEQARFLPSSIVIAETVEVVAQTMLPHLPGADAPTLMARMNAAASQVPQVEATPLIPFCQTLAARGITLGIATNDAEAPARTHLEAAGIIDAFAFVAGFDSGHGGKPAPGQLHAFCEATGLDPAACVMVGDSLHDLHAGRAAGMRTVGVLTGPAPRAELSPEADIVLGSIAELPDWLATQI